MGLGQRPREGLPFLVYLRTVFSMFPEAQEALGQAEERPWKLEEWPQHSRQSSKEDLEPSRKTDLRSWDLERSCAIGI